MQRGKTSSHVTRIKNLTFSEKCAKIDIQEDEMKKYIALLITVLLLAGFSLGQEKKFSNDFSLFLKPSNVPETKQADKEKKDWVFTGLVGIYITLSAVDLYTTMVGLDNGCEEANPLWRGLVKDKPTTILVKTLMTGVVTYVAYKAKEINKPVGYIVFGAVIVLQAVVVVHNLHVMRS